MSTPTHDTDRTVVPPPRGPADPPAGAQEAPRPEARHDEPVGLLGRHGWLIPVLGVAATVAVFVSMILLTWLAGGGTPFD